MKIPFLKKKTQQPDSTELLKFNPYCPNCDSDIGADETGQMQLLFCPDCSTKLIQPSRCVWCNNPVNASAKYCTGCGMMIKR